MSVVRYDPALDLERALSELAAASAAAGVALWRPAESLDDLEELEAAVAPMRLPEIVRRFWTLVDVRTLRVQPYPEFVTPETAHTFWRQSRDAFRSTQPLTLVDVGYQSHQCMSVELDVGDVAGGALFESAVEDPSGFTRRFNELPDWLSYLAELVRRGLYQPLDTPDGAMLVVPGSENAEAERALRPTPAPHPVHGSALRVGGDILDWPGHWQRVNGLRESDLRPRGATHTIGQVLASPPAEPLRATIAGKVTALAAGASWARVRVRDGTGAIDVFCPAKTTLLGPGLGGSYEFDIVLEAGPRPVSAPDDAGAEIDGRLAGGPACATAEAVRRLPAPQ